MFLGTNKKVNKNLGYFVFTVFVLLIVGCIVIHANWILGDDKQCMMYSGSGIWKPMITDIGGGISGGRFGPFSHFEYNLLTLIPYGYTPLAHYIFNSLLFVVLSFLSTYLCLIILRDNFSELDILYSVLVYIFVFVASQHILSYIEVQYAHRMMSILLVSFMLMLYFYLKTKRVVFLYISFFFVIWTTYSYEVMFCVFATIGITFLLFNKNSNAFKWFLYMLVLNAFLYLGIYALWIYPNITDSYLGMTTEWSFILRVFIWAPQTLVAIVLSIYRLWSIIIKKDKMHLFFDSTLFSAAILTLSYFVLKQAPIHNYQCVAILLIPSLCFWGYKFYIENKTVFFCFVILFLFVFIRPLHVFQYTIKNFHMHRQEDMRSVEEIAKRIDNNKARFVYRSLNNRQKHKVDIGDYVNTIFYLKFVLHHEVLIDSIREIDGKKYPSFFLTRNTRCVLTEKEKDYIKQNYDSITSLGDFECVFYQLKSNR